MAQCVFDNVHSQCFCRSNSSNGDRDRVYVEEGELSHEEVKEVERISVDFGPVLGRCHCPCGESYERGDEFSKNEIHEW